MYDWVRLFLGLEIRRQIRGQMNSFLKTKKIGFIGAGNMTKSLISGLSYNKDLDGKNIYVCNRSSEKAEALKRNYGVHAVEHIDDVLEVCDVVVLSVKPQDLKPILESYGKSFDETQTVLSLCAGITVDSLAEFLPQIKNTNIARLMPSTTCEFGKGVLGVYSESSNLVKELEEYFESVGFVCSVETEEELDSIMVSAASGVGFVLEFMQIWSEWLEEMGFDKESSEEITKISFGGVAEMLKESSESFSSLQSKVTSKKGVTLAGLESMRSLNLDGVLNKSFAAALKRSKEMSDML